MAHRCPQPQDSVTEEYVTAQFSRAYFARYDMMRMACNLQISLYTIGIHIIVYGVAYNRKFWYSILLSVILPYLLLNFVSLCIMWYLVNPFDDNSLRFTRALRTGQRLRASAGSHNSVSCVEKLVQFTHLLIVLLSCLYVNSFMNAY